MNIPTIGGAKGIFEIFVPGLFLFLNLVLVLYLFPFSEKETNSLISLCISNQIFGLVITISFSYLIGVILRLFRTDLADEWSAKFIRRFKSSVKQDGVYKLFAIENFPYLNWIGEVSKSYLSEDAEKFYKEFWHIKKEHGHKNFFNFNKVLITSVDERSANEIYSAEALTRYISSMFYALFFSFCLISFTLILRYIVLGTIMKGLLIISTAYLFAMLGILAHFRFIRIKEVETVFAACFINQSKIKKKLATPDKSLGKN